VIVPGGSSISVLALGVADAAAAGVAAVGAAGSSPEHPARTQAPPPTAASSNAGHPRVPKTVCDLGIDSA